MEDIGCLKCVLANCSAGIWDSEDNDFEKWGLKYDCSIWEKGYQNPHCKGGVHIGVGEFFLPQGDYF